MPDAKRPDPKRRSPASRPAKPGDSVRRGRSAKSSRPAQTATARNTTRTLQEHVVEPIKRQIAESVEQRSDQRLGFTARRAAILAAVVCVLTLTIAGPVRTYFAQRTDRKSTRLNSSHITNSYAVFCLKKKKIATSLQYASHEKCASFLWAATDISTSVALLAASDAFFSVIFSFFFNDTATTEIYTLSLHDALPISSPNLSLPLNLQVRLIIRVSRGM